MSKMKWYVKINETVMFKIADNYEHTVFQANADTLEYLLVQVFEYLNISQQKRCSFYSKTNNIYVYIKHFDGMCSYDANTDTLKFIDESIHYTIKEIILKSIPEKIPYLKDKDKYFRVCGIWMDVNNCKLLSINEAPKAEIGYGKESCYHLDFGVTYSEGN